MDNQLIPQEEFQTYTSLDGTTGGSQTESPSDSGILTTRTLNINSVSNNNLDSLYGLGETSVITDYDTLLVYINELLIRFDTSPKYYQKEDYRHLIKTIVDSLKYLYADSVEINLDIETIFQHLDNIEIELDTKVDKTEGKGLSTNDLTNTLKSYYDLAYQHSLLTNNPHNVTIQQIGAEAVGTAQSLIDDLNLGDIITHDADEFAPALTEDENYITDLEKSNLHAPGSDNQIASDFDIKDLADSDSLRNFWNSKQDPLGFTPENISNKKNTLTDSDTDYPTTNAVNIGLSNKVDKIENYSLISDTDIDRLSHTSGVNTGDQDLSNLLSLQHISDFNHADIVHQNRIALDSVSGINTGDQDLSSLATKSEMTSGLLLKVDKEAGKGLSTEDYTTAEKNKVANIPLNTNAELGLKVDKIVGNSLVPDEDIITLQNTSGINTGDQLADNETITGSGKSNDPFIANIKIIESEIPPPNPIQGLRWFNLTNGIEYTYIQDTWVDLNGNTFLPVAHENLTDKNSEAAFQHVDTTTIKPTLAPADMVAVKDSVTGKMVLTPKSNIDESFKKLAVRRGAVFNETTGFYEMNGLTDITEAQMMDIYNYTSHIVNTNNWTEVFAFMPILTNYQSYNIKGNATYVNAQNAFTGATKFKVFKQYNGINISNIKNMFSGCTSLVTVDRLNLNAVTTATMVEAFKNCYALITCLIRSINGNISFSQSPLLSLESLQYIIQYRANGTTPITIIVHPTVFAKLTDNVNYPTWYAVNQDALTKYITFAS